MTPRTVQDIEIAQPVILVSWVCDELEATARVTQAEHLAAALITAGFRLAAGINREDCYEGLRHVSEIKGCRLDQLTRVITWRFVADEVKREGWRMGVQEFAQRWREDEAWRAKFRGATFEQILAMLLTAIEDQRPCFKLSNPEAHDRELIIPVGGDPEMIARLARDYENGF